MWRSCCCGTTSGSDEIPMKKESDGPPPESNPTATSGLEGSSGADIFFESDQRVRSKSASEALRVPQPSLKVKSPTPSLENIIEQQEGKSSPQIRVIRNYGTASLSESSDSIYRTPPTTRRITEKDVPLRNPLATRSVVARPDDMTGSYRSSISSLPREPVQQQDHHQLQALLSKIEEVEQVRMKQHEDLMKMIAEKIDTLVTEIRDSRESERRVSTDGVKPQDGKGEYRNIGESQLPRNIPVSPKVLLKLSERVPRKWKFLARRLEVEEHQIQQIRGDNQGDIQEQSYQMLLLWGQAQGGGSYQALGEAVRLTFGEQLHLEYVKMVVEEERHNLIPNSQ